MKKWKLLVCILALFVWSSEISLTAAEDRSVVRTVNLTQLAQAQGQTIPVYLADQFNQKKPATFVENDVNIFSQYSTGLPSTYASGNWASKFDFSGVAWNGLNAGTLVTDQYMIRAAHFPRGAGAKVYFNAPDGTVVERVIVATRNLKHYDSRILDGAVDKLNAPVPTNIKVYPLLDPSGIGNISDLIGAPYLMTDKTRKVFAEEIYSFNSFSDSTYSGDQLVNFWKKNDVPSFMFHAAVGGDSGDPQFMIVDGHLVVTGTLFGYSAGKMINDFYGFQAVQNALSQAMIDMKDINGYYTLTVNNGSGDDIYKENYVGTITADAPSLFYQEFDTWVGDTANIVDPHSATTTITMPATDVTITATYKDLPAGAEMNLTQQGDIVATVLNDLTYRIRDGVKPAVGTASTSYQYHTLYYNISTPYEEYVGYTYNTPYVFSKLIFQEGFHYDSGGFFRDGTLRVQVLQNGQWNDVAATIDTPYPVGNAKADFGEYYETYTFTINDIEGDGIRIIGNAGGSSHFITVAELEAFGAYPTGNPVNHAPVVNAGADQTITLPATATLDGTVSDDGLPNAMLTTQWSKVSGPGTVTFGNAAAVDTSATFATAGTYVLRLTADDSALQTSDDITVTVNPVAVTQYTLTYTAGANGSITGTSSQTVDQGADGTTVTAVADTGYHFVSWSDTVSSAARTDTNVQADITVTANFAVDVATTYALTVNSGSGSGTYAAGASVNITADAVAGKEFDAWTGDTANLADVASATTSITMPAVDVTITATYKDLPPGSEIDLTQEGDIIATVTAPLGGGDHDINIIRDGVKPNEGTTDSKLQYDTFDRNAAPFEEYVGYTYNTTYEFTRLVFQEGKHFFDGGFFANGSLRVQVLQNGQWNDVTAVIERPYPVGTLPSDFGTSFETYTFTLASIQGDGIRIIGDAGGSAHFISVGELEVFGNLPGGTPVNQAPVVNAGADQAITLPATATLDGTVSDDGLPTATVTTQWSKVSGPGTVTFGNAGVVDTSATFASAGTYVLRLTADDSELQAGDDVTVTVNPKPVIYYTLIVNSGSGDGDYEEGSSVDITADTAPSGQTFDAWIGDTANLADAFSPVTTVTISTVDVIVTATYKDIPPVNGLDITQEGDIIATVTTPLGGGNKEINIIRDGVKPAEGTTDSTLQYDTFDRDAPPYEEYIGYAYNQTFKFRQIVFQEGKHFFDGGFFTNESLRVQVRRNGQWNDVVSVIDKPYPIGNDRSEFGTSFETYTFNLNDEEGDGIRLIGDAGGTAHFISVGELEVFQAPEVNLDITQKGDIIATVMAPLGGGNHDINIIRDGVKPAEGTTDSILQYDTFDRNAGPFEEYIGYSYNQTYKFSQIVFQEGKHFFDGGFFNGAPRIQIRQNGQWNDVVSVIDKPYPIGNDRSDFGTSFETYIFNLNNEEGDGIRLIGDAGGTAHFISVGELEVFQAP